MLRILFYSGLCLGLAWNATAFAAHSAEHNKPTPSKTAKAPKASTKTRQSHKLEAKTFLSEILKVPAKEHKNYELTSITPRKVGSKHETWVLYRKKNQFGFARVTYAQSKWQIIKHNDNFYQNGVNDYVFKQAKLKLFGLKTLIAIEDGEGGVMPKTTLRLFNPFSLQTAGELTLSAKMSPVDGSDFETTKLALKPDAAGISDIVLTQNVAINSRAGSRKYLRIVTYRWVKDKNRYMVGATKEQEVL